MADPLVPVDPERIRAALLRVEYSHAAVARLSGITTKKLSALLTGRNRKMRRSARGRLMRVLRSAMRLNSAPNGENRTGDDSGAA